MKRLFLLLILLGGGLYGALTTLGEGPQQRLGLGTIDPQDARPSPVAERPSPQPAAERMPTPAQADAGAPLLPAPDNVAPLSREAAPAAAPDSLLIPTAQPAATSANAPLLELGPATQPATEATTDAQSEPLPAPSSLSVEVRQVTAEAVNVRDGPSTGYAAVGRLLRGATVEIHGRDGNWVQIRHTADGTEGWVSVRLLSEPLPR